MSPRLDGQPSLSSSSKVCCKTLLPTLKYVFFSPSFFFFPFSSRLVSIHKGTVYCGSRTVGPVRISQDNIPLSTVLCTNRVLEIRFFGNGQHACLLLLDACFKTSQNDMRLERSCTTAFATFSLQYSFTNPHLSNRLKVWTLPSCTFLTSKSTKLQSKEEELSELTVESTSTNLLHPTLNWSLPKRRKLLKRLLKRRLSDCLPDKEVD